MTLMEAINNVCLHMHRQQAVFTLHRARQLAEAHYQISVHQNQPEDTYRTFDVAPDPEIADCWNITEVEVNGNG